MGLSRHIEFFEAFLNKGVNKNLPSQADWRNLENEAWKAPGSPKLVLDHFLNKTVNKKLPFQAIWANLENEAWKVPGSPK